MRHQHYRFSLLAWVDSCLSYNRNEPSRKLPSVPWRKWMKLFFYVAPIYLKKLFSVWHQDFRVTLWVWGDSSLLWIKMQSSPLENDIYQGFDLHIYIVVPFRKHMFTPDLAVKETFRKLKKGWQEGLAGLKAVLILIHISPDDDLWFAPRISYIYIYVYSKGLLVKMGWWSRDKPKQAKHVSLPR